MPDHTIAAAPAVASPFDRLLEAIAAPLRTLSETQARQRFAVDAGDVLIKTTLSLCPECLGHVPAAVVRRQRQVWIRKACASHGVSEAVLENDAAFYRVSSKDRWGRCYGEMARQDIPAFAGSCCGPGRSCAPAASTTAPAQGGFTDQTGNKTCTVLVEITNACNLACRVCYSDSKGDRVLPVEDFKLHLIEMARQKGRLDSVQVTGGEASLHPQFWEILEWLCAQEAVGKVYLPTNGLLFNRPGFIERLAPLRERVLVLLQFDGRDEVADPSLRGVKPERNRLQLIRALDRRGICMQLTMTLSHGVNEADIGLVVAQGLRHPQRAPRRDAAGFLLRPLPARRAGRRAAHALRLRARAWSPAWAARPGRRTSCPSRAATPTAAG